MALSFWRVVRRKQRALRNIFQHSAFFLSAVSSPLFTQSTTLKAVHTRTNIFKSQRHYVLHAQIHQTSSAQTLFQLNRNGKCLHMNARRTKTRFLTLTNINRRCVAGRKTTKWIFVCRKANKNTTRCNEETNLFIHLVFHVKNRIGNRISCHTCAIECSLHFVICLLISWI